MDGIHGLKNPQHQKSHSKMDSLKNPFSHMGICSFLVFRRGLYQQFLGLVVLITFRPATWDDRIFTVIILPDC